MDYSEVPRGLVLDPAPRRHPRAIEVLRGLHPDLVDVDLGVTYHDNWSGFSVVFVGTTPTLLQTIRETPPDELPGLVVVYGDEDPIRFSVYHELAKQAQGTASRVEEVTYKDMRRLLHHEGDGVADFFSP